MMALMQKFICSSYDATGVEWLGLNEVTIIISALALAIGSYFVSLFCFLFSQTQMV